MDRKLLTRTRGTPGLDFVHRDIVNVSARLQPTGLDVDPEDVVDDLLHVM